MRSAFCDIGFHFGTDGTNIEQLQRAQHHQAVFGLKVYFNETTGELMIDDLAALEGAFASWTVDKPILVHAEQLSVATALGLAQAHRRRLHVCHIAGAAEVGIVRAAKAAGLHVTCGVCPHHLYLTDADVSRLGSLAQMKPPLGSAADCDALWEGLADGTIDLIETDHAPHLLEEKAHEPAPFGVPGLETALPLLMLALHDGRLSLDDVVRLMHDTPRRVFSIPEQPDTYIELDPHEPHVIGTSGYETKAGWSPFDGVQAYGAVQSVVIRGKRILSYGRLTAQE